MIDAYLCWRRHVIPATSQFYAQDFSEGLNDADGTPMYEHGLWCSCCEEAYGLSRLTELPRVLAKDAAVVHDLQLFRHVAQNPLPD